MSFGGDIGEGLRWRYSLVVCFLLFFIALISQSWSLFLITLGILLLGTADVWIWWLPGLSRKEKFPVQLQGAAQRKLRTEQPREWLIQGVRFFRDLGFFARDHHLDDEALADKIEEAHRAEWGGDFNANSPHADYFLLKADEDRVWWKDAEA